MVHKTSAKLQPQFVENLISQQCEVLQSFIKLIYRYDHGWFNLYSMIISNLRHLWIICNITTIPKISVYKDILEYFSINFQWRPNNFIKYVPTTFVARTFSSKNTSSHLLNWRSWYNRNIRIKYRNRLRAKPGSNSAHDHLSTTALPPNSC